MFGVNLLNGGYWLMNLNEHWLDFIKPNESILFEAYGDKDKYIYFDIKMCSGDVKA